MNDVAVLIFCEDSQYSWPAAFHLLSGIQQFGSGRVHVGFRLEPSGQPSTAGTRRTLDQIPKEQPLVRIATVDRKKNKIFKITGKCGTIFELVAEIGTDRQTEAVKVEDW